MAVGNTTVNITVNAQPVIDAITAMVDSWLEFGELMIAAAESMARGVQVLREQQEQETGDMWGETEEPFVCDTHENCQFSESA